jgi:anaerobic selenocysteine-containing dehydrogenase
LWGWVHNRALPDGKWRIAPPVLLDRLPDVWSTPDDGDLVFVARRARRAVNALRYTRREDDDKEPPDLLIHPEDALARALLAGQLVDVTSHAGTVSAVVRPEPRVPIGTVSLTHGWTDPNAAALIANEVDPLTGQPFFTAFPVELATTASSSPRRGGLDRENGKGTRQ